MIYKILVLLKPLRLIQENVLNSKNIQIFYLKYKVIIKIMINKKRFYCKINLLLWECMFLKLDYKYFSLFILNSHKLYAFN